MNTWVYDLEQFRNFHSGVFLNVETGEIKSFVIHQERNELEEYVSFLDSVKGLIGFNNISYDYPLLHYLLETGDYKGLFDKSQEIISSDFPTVRRKDVLIPQLDLYRIWHFNNKARATGLKKLQIAMKWHRVQDLPLPYDAVIMADQIDEVLDYNLNDVLSTHEFYLKTKPAINLRKQIGKVYGIKVINRPDTGMGEDIFGSILSKELNIPLRELKQMRTERPTITFSDCIVPYVSYKSKEFKSLLDRLRATTITETKDSIKESVIYKGFKYDFGVGKTFNFDYD